MDIISEILLQKGERVVLARVLLAYRLPFRKYPKFGTWSYLLDAGEEVVIFDTGPRRYNFAPFFANLRSLTYNSSRIMAACDLYYPGKPIREIILSHYHFDHAEVAPELQSLAAQRFGELPPIRIHEADFEGNKFLHLFNYNLAKVYEKAKYKEWLLGDFVKDDEEIGGTDFIIKHLPGHTSGTIGLYNEPDQIMICDWGIRDLKGLLALGLKFVNEANAQLRDSHQWLKELDYTFYHFHPDVEDYL
ncbi:MAG TPA: MBL fold metallo-hydrolase [Candidatus Wirthbacteria bacterium]|nr:MBL fold metallo-hydrolase [Candidatus Wirthbacteria bacterium]